MHISLFNIPLDGEGEFLSFFFFSFCVNQRAQEPSLGLFFVFFFSLNMAESMVWLYKAHAFNKPFPGSSWWIKTTEQLTELYINKCKAENPRNLYLVTAVTTGGYSLCQGMGPAVGNTHFFSKVGHWAVVQSNLLSGEKNLGSGKCFQGICTFWNTSWVWFLYKLMF